MSRLACCLAVAILLAGCNSDPVLDLSAPLDPTGPLSPPGRASGGDIIDPLIVGDRLLAAGEAELALASYIRAAAGPSGPTIDIRLSIARANIELRRLKQAERMLRGIITEAPRNAAAFNDLGVVLTELGQNGEANRLFKTAFALQPLPEILANLRISDANLKNPVYGVEADNAFTLTRAENGLYGLNSPGQFP